MSTTAIFLFPHPALLIKTENRSHLIICDLHIGFEDELKHSGVKIETETEKMLNELILLIKEYKPHELIILGDIKNSVNRINDVEWENVPAFLGKLVDMTNVVIVPGNHDGGIIPLLPREVKLVEKSGLMIKDNALLHGDTRPSNQLENVKRLIMAHIHPTYKKLGSPLTGTQVWIVLKAERVMIFEGTIGYLEFIIMPSFNKDLSMISYGKAHDGLISPILRRIKNKIEEANIITLDGDIIGDISSLQYVL